MSLPDAMDGMCLAVEKVLRDEEDYDETAACLIANLTLRTAFAWLRSPEAVEVRRGLARVIQAAFAQEENYGGDSLVAAHNALADVFVALAGDDA